MSDEVLLDRLTQRWAAPDPQRVSALGKALWEDLLTSPWGELITPQQLEVLLLTVVTPLVSATVWDDLPRAVLKEHTALLRDGGETLGDLVGPQGADRLRELVSEPATVDPELVMRLLDQPIVRQAFRDTLQRGIQQYLQTLSTNLPFSKAQVGPTGGMVKGVLGELSRGLASRAKETVQIGKTWADSMGLTGAFEQNIQPFLTGYASRALKGLVEQIFDSKSGELAVEARLGALEVLLETPLRELVPEPSLDGADLRLRLGAAIAAHLATRESYHTLIREVTLSLWRRLEGEQVHQTLYRLDLPREGVPELVEALGLLGHRVLSRPGFSAWLAEEIRAVRPG